MLNQSARSLLAHQNMPNALTLLRLGLVPVFAYYLFTPSSSHALLAATIFLFASITDFVDGFLARKHQTVSKFGKLADPIVDKALTGCAFIGLSIHYGFAWWMTLVILGRELVVTVARMLVASHTVIAANLGGKVKTVLQIVAVIAWLLKETQVDRPIEIVATWTLLDLTTFVANLASYLALIVTVATGLSYLRQVFSVVRSRP